MKKFYLVILTLVFVTNSYSQESLDNVFVGLNGGATLTIADHARQDFKDLGSGKFISPNGSFYFGKWLHPEIGVRVAYDYGLNRVNVNGDVKSFQRHSIFTDALYNISDLTYNESKWNFIPYAGIGYIGGTGNSYVGTTNSIGTRIGLLVSYNITKSWNINAELNGVATEEHFNSRVFGLKYDIYSTLSLGVSYNFNK
jgi:hypothetical protein